MEQKQLQVRFFRSRAFVVKNIAQKVYLNSHVNKDYWQKIHKVCHGKNWSLFEKFDVFMVRD